MWWPLRGSRCAAELEVELPAAGGALLAAGCWMQPGPGPGSEAAPSLAPSTRQPLRGRRCLRPRPGLAGPAALAVQKSVPACRQITPGGPPCGCCSARGWPARSASWWAATSITASASPLGCCGRRRQRPEFHAHARAFPPAQNTSPALPTFPAPHSRRPSGPVCQPPQLPTQEGKGTPCPMPQPAWQFSGPGMP